MFFFVWFGFVLLENYLYLSMLVGDDDAAAAVFSFLFLLHVYALPDHNCYSLAFGLLSANWQSCKMMFGGENISTTQLIAVENAGMERFIQFPCFCISNDAGVLILLNFC